MKKIASFTVNHDILEKGMYISRIDGDVVTYDVRMKKPNGGDYFQMSAAHTLEHLFATYARNSKHGDKIVYVGPMGCRTGFYLLVQGLDDEEIKALIKKTLEKIVCEADEMFGMDEIQCGNYRELSLEAGKNCAKEYLAQLNFEKMDFSYPTEGAEV